MRAIDFDDPVYSRQEMERPSITPPTEQEVASLLDILRKKLAYQRVDLYAEPVYRRSIEIELFIVMEWASSRSPICIDCREAPQREYFRCWACLAAWRRKTET